MLKFIITSPIQCKLCLECTILESLHQIALSLTPVGFIIFLGWFAGYKGFVTKSHSHSFATYVMSFSFPCSLFVLTATSSPAELLNGSFVMALWIGLIGMYFISFIIYKLILKRNITESTQGAFVCSFPDMAFMGIPIFTALLGKQALLSIAIGNICTSLVMIPFVTIFLNAGRGTTTENIGTIIWKVIKKPLVFAPILGTIYSLCNLHLPDIAKNSLSLIGSTTSGVSLFALGLIMSSFAIKFSKLVSVNIILKNILHPLIMAGLVMLFGVKGIFAREAILLCAMPTATMTTMFALKYDTLIEESATSAILGTIVALITLTIFMLLLGI